MISRQASLIYFSNREDQNAMLENSLSLTEKINGFALFFLNTLILILQPFSRHSEHNPSPLLLQSLQEMQDILCMNTHIAAIIPSSCSKNLWMNSTFSNFLQSLLFNTQNFYIHPHLTFLQSWNLWISCRKRFYANIRCI